MRDDLIASRLFTFFRGFLCARTNGHKKRKKSQSEVVRSLFGSNSLRLRRAVNSVSELRDLWDETDFGIQVLDCTPVHGGG